MYSVTIFGIPNCPQCDAAFKMSETKGFLIDKKSLRDEDILEEVKADFEDRGQVFPRAAPIIYVEDEDQYFDFSGFQAWFRNV